MFDQLIASAEKARRLPSRSPTNERTPHQEPRSTQRYDAFAPPHRASGFGRSASSPEYQRRADPPVLVIRHPTAPASFPSPQEEVKMAQQTSKEAWNILGRRFHATRTASPTARTSRVTTEPALRSSAPDFPSYLTPSRTLKPVSRRSTPTVSFAPIRQAERERMSSVAPPSGIAQRERSSPTSLPLPPLPPLFLLEHSRAPSSPFHPSSLTYIAGQRGGQQSAGRGEATRPGRIGPLFSRRLKRDGCL